MFDFNRSCNRCSFCIYNSVPCIPCNGITLNWKKGNTSGTITPYLIEANVSNLPSSVTVDPVDMVKHVVEDINSF